MTGATGATGATRATGATGATGASFDMANGAGSTVVRPIGISPAVLKRDNPQEDWWRGNLWPPGADEAKLYGSAPRRQTGPNDVDLLQSGQRPGWEHLPGNFRENPTDTGKHTFARRAWAHGHMATVILGEFVAAPPLAGTSWNGLEPLLTPIAQAHLANFDKEMREMHRLAEYRAAVLSEAQAQSASFIDYFCGVLSFNPASHPYTFDLLCAVMKVGEFVAMHYKHKFAWPRPSHISPSLMPPIDPPGHASFPSGHATQAYLAALVLGEDVGGARVMPKEAVPALRRLAERVARNREVLGLHYPADSEAGWVLATECHPRLHACPTFQDAFKQASQEWR